MASALTSSKVFSANSRNVRTGEMHEEHLRFAPMNGVRAMSWLSLPTCGHPDVLCRHPVVSTT
ncbi:hypothetical protein ACFLXF_04260 [Chloroflexota bacterium]